MSVARQWAWTYPMASAKLFRMGDAFDFQMHNAAPDRFEIRTTPMAFNEALLPQCENWMSVFGWHGDKHAAWAYPGGRFLLRDNGGLKVSFGIFDGVDSYDWYNHSGYLPCLVTAFDKGVCTVKVMTFGDRLDVDGNAFVAAYARVEITNNGTSSVMLDPAPRGALVTLASSATDVAPGTTVRHDYAAWCDRFGNTYPFPPDGYLAAAGSWDDHFAHMKAYCDEKLAEIVQITTPDAQLNEGYRAGFLTTLIVNDNHDLMTGETRYDGMFNHDAVGILATLLQIGYYSEASELLTAFPSDGYYLDGTWKYPWPWAIYAHKTGDTAFIRAHWDNLKTIGRGIGEKRTGPGGVMCETNGNDEDGYWTLDDWSALTGLLSYAYLAGAIGEEAEQTWAMCEYRALLDACNDAVSGTIARHGLSYIPLSLFDPNEKYEFSADPTGADWAGMFLFGRWAWDGWLLGGAQYGVNFDMIDATYDYGFARVRAAGIPEGNFGGLPGWSSGYNAGWAAGGLRGDKYRTAGIRAYQFMIENTQSGPYAWHERIGRTVTGAWRGKRGTDGNVSCPHMWSQAVATKVLLDSIVAEFFDGRLVVGRGVPDEWLEEGVTVDNFPIAGGRRLGLTIRAASSTVVRLELRGDAPGGEIVFSLPAFIGNIAAAEGGVVDVGEGTVTFAAGTREMDVRLNRAVS
jgi:hypothetical protein